MLLGLINDIATTQLPYAQVFGQSASTQTFSTNSITCPANCTVWVGVRAGRNGHSAATSWSIVESSGTLGTYSSSGTFSESGGTFGREMVFGKFPTNVGGSPPTITITADAWATADTGVYCIVVVFTPTTYSLSQAVGFASDTSTANNITVSLASASTNPTVAIIFGEDNTPTTSTWGTPETGWYRIGTEDPPYTYYHGQVLYNPTGDASGSTNHTLNSTSVQTVAGIIADFTVTGGPVSGSSRFALTNTFRITGTKLATTGSARLSANIVGDFAGSKLATNGSNRLALPITARNTVGKIYTTGASVFSTPIVGDFALTKIASTASVKFAAPIVGDFAGSKIGLGASSFSEVITGRFTGTQTANLISDSVRMLVTITARATGTKLTTGGRSTVAAPIVERVTGGKIYNTGAVTMSVPIVERITTAKIGLSSARILLPITNRNTAIKIGLGTPSFQLPITSRSTGTKTTTTGSSRFLVGITENILGSKIALGNSARFLETITAIAFGSQSTAIQGLTRHLLTITARASGTKLTTGASVRIAEPITMRSSASKSIFGAASTFSVPVTMRNTVAKIASNSAIFAFDITSRNTGTKILTGGSSRFLSGAVMRNTGAKTITTGSARMLNTITSRTTLAKSVTGGARFQYVTWFSAFRHIGTSPIARYTAISLSGPRHMTFIRRTATYTHIYNERHVTFNASNGQIVEK